MQKTIYYNRNTQQVSLDQQRWIDSSKLNQYSQPIFDFNEQDWCVISITANQEALKCSAKEKMFGNTAWYYQGYVKLSEIVDGIITFHCYRVEKNPATNKWERPKW